MKLYKHKFDGMNCDLTPPLNSKEAYLELIEQYGWKDIFPEPVVECHEISGDKQLMVVREDLVPGGAKTRFGDLLVKCAQNDTLVYVQPRYGFAGMALAHLCSRYGKNLILFCPACKEISQHQAAVYHLGAQLFFYRIAAMPRLNAIARQYASERGYMFVPFGLHHPLVTACGVKVASDLAERIGYPEQAWTVISTGVLTRALQIAWPNTQFHGVAVARALQPGEAGRAIIQDSQYKFHDKTDYPPPFPSVNTYDAKAWQHMYHQASNNSIFWNVASDIEEQQVPSIKSDYAWGEKCF